MIEITERDERFLLSLNFSGVCKSSFIETIYPEEYGRKRMRKMEKEKIINRTYGLITLGINGQKYLENLEEQPKMVSHLPRTMLKRLAQALELKRTFYTMQIIPSNEYKQLRNLNRGMQFTAAGITKDNIEYLIYDIPKTLSTDSMNFILKELRNKKSIVSNVIILTTNNTFVQKLFSENVYIRECFVIPTNDLFISLLLKLGEGDFDKNILTLAFPEELGKCPELFEDKEVV